MLRTVCLLFVPMMLILISGTTAQSTKPPKIKKRLPATIEQHKLYVQARDRKFRKRIRERATVILVERGDTLQRTGRIRQVGRDGLFFAPFVQLKDSFLYDTVNQVYTPPIWWDMSDTIEFIHFDSIASFAYHNGYEGKVLACALIGTTGTSIALPAAILGLADGGIDSFGWTGAGIVGGGTVIALYGIWWFYRLQRYRLYSMEQYELLSINPRQKLHQRIEKQEAREGWLARVLN